jgi:cardiolipin synthase A/B
MDSTLFLSIALVCISFVTVLLLVALFGPGHKYKLKKAPPQDLTSKQFLRMLEALSDAQLHHNSRIEVLTNGEAFYEAELDALRAARHSINLEAYIFQKGEVTRRFLEVMTERARNGVQVHLVLDAIGSFASWNSYFRDLTDAGGQVAWYHPLNWHTLPRINNRTHRELIIVDGEIGFIGGAGFADHWVKNRPGHPRWRDTMCRVTGDAVAGLQSTFTQNWLEASGEILAGPGYFPFQQEESDAVAMVVNSAPSAGYSTRARMLFQTLLASARESIYITTPYFLPDQSAREEMISAVDRGVEVRILVPGDYNDHKITRRSSRRLYGELLQAGAHIYEYQPSMIHAKIMVVDGIWSVVGSTNFDNRSFGLNDEVNLAALDKGLAGRLLEDFANDIAQSQRITYEQWVQRPRRERFYEWIGWVLERQQ